MRLYIIGFMVGVIGLVAANQVRAEEGCGLRSADVLKAESWISGKTGLSDILLSVTLVSMDAKPIREVTGSIEFISGGTSFLSLPIRLESPVRPAARFVLDFKLRDSTIAANASGVGINALVCISSIVYTDGSGVIIN